MKKNNEGGTWDSIHVVEVIENGNSARYKLTSTVMLQLIVQASQKFPAIDLSGNLTRQSDLEQSLDSPNSHISNIGRMVEEMEIKMRNSIQDIYFGKTRDILNSLRSINDLNSVKNQNAIQAQLLGRLKERNEK
jgi:capping protein beta